MDFDPKDPNKPLQEIIPQRKQPAEYQEILEEIDPIVKELSADISGIGPKAAERYLLRFEYGIATQEIANRENISPQTVSSQVSKVRSKVLKFPRLARILGSLRSHRANLERPEIESGQSWSGQITLHDVELEYDLEYTLGNPGRSYTWKFDVEITFENEDTIYHLFADYLINGVSGVFLKRTQRGISLQSWNKPPLTEKYKYSTYPLPNVEVPNLGDGSLLSAVEYHLPFDVKNDFSWLIERDEGWADLEKMAHSANPKTLGAHYSDSDQLIYRIKTGTEEFLTEFTRTRHIRNNLERLMRLYPFKRPYDLPDETFTQLWNGQPATGFKLNSLAQLSKQQIYGIAHDVDSHHRGRDVRTGAKTHAINTNLWI